MSVQDTIVQDATGQDPTSPHGAQDRRDALTAVLAGLLCGVDRVPLTALFDVFEDGEDAEVASAGGAIVTIYLRADTATRRRLRPLLVEATRARSDTRLAAVLLSRLGAVAGPAGGGR